LKIFRKSLSKPTELRARKFSSKLTSFKMTRTELSVRLKNSMNKLKKGNQRLKDLTNRPTKLRSRTKLWVKTQKGMNIGFSKRSPGSYL